MPIPLIPVVAGAAALWLVLTSKGAAKPGKKSTVKPAGNGMVTTTVPTVDGKGYKLTCKPEDLNDIMAYATANDADKMTWLAAHYKAQGKKSESTACMHLAAVIATHAATGGKPVKETTAKKSTAAAEKASKKTSGKEKTVPVAAVSSPGVVATGAPAAPPDALIQALKTAVANGGDPATLRKLADQLDALGFPAQAAAARAAADESEAALQAAQAAKLPAPAPTPVAIPTVPTNIAASSPGIATAPQLTPLPAPPVVATPVIPAAAPVPVATVPALPAPVPQAPATPRRLAADALVQHLMVDRPAFGKENQALVRAYEQALGESPSGKYGLGLAHSLADSASGAHVPPPVRYWPASASSIAKWGNYTKAANDYDTWLMAQKANDGARAAEWQDAYKHARDFWPSGSKPQPRK